MHGLLNTRKALDILIWILLSYFIFQMDVWVRWVVLFEVLLLSFKTHVLAVTHREIGNQLKILRVLNLHVWCLRSLGLSHTTLVLLFGLGFMRGSWSILISPYFFISLKLVDWRDLRIHFVVLLNSPIVFSLWRQLLRRWREKHLRVLDGWRILS